MTRSSAVEPIRGADGAPQIRLAISSETPVLRAGWGAPWVEILDHQSSSVDLARLERGVALLFNRDRFDGHIGVVEKPELGADRVLRGTPRFSSSELAQQKKRDVEDGTLRWASVGYRIIERRLEKRGDAEKREPDIFRVVRWEPVEVSLCTIPADANTGVGRDAPTYSVRTLDEHGREIKLRGGVMGGEFQVGDDRTQLEIARQREIRALGKQFNFDVERFLEDGSGPDIVRAAILAEIRKRHAPALATVDMTAREQQQYSFTRAILMAAGKRRREGLESEYSDHLAKSWERAHGPAGPDSILVPTGLQVAVPPNPRQLEALQERAMLVGTPAAGGYTVPTMMQTLIEFLTNRTVVKALGATILSGLSGGKIAIPRADSGFTSYWLAEDEDTTISDPVFSQVTLAPIRLQACGRYSDELLVQSSVAVDNFVRMALARSLAVAWDYAALAGSGTGEPKGVLNQTGVGAVAMGPTGGAPTYAKLVSFLSAIAAANAEAATMAWVATPETRGKLMTTAVLDSTYSDTPVWTMQGEAGRGAVLGFRAEATNQLPKNYTKSTGTNLHGMVFGDWSQLILAEWSGAIELLVDPYSEAGKAATKIHAKMFGDVGVAHPAAFAVSKDVNAA